MGTHGYLNTRGLPVELAVGTHMGTRRARVSYLSNGAETCIILSAHMDIH